MKGLACRCLKSDRANWRVTQYKCNHSAFNGYRYTPSAYSDVRCMGCGGFWRTKAAYVEELPRATREEVLRAISAPRIP